MIPSLLRSIKAYFPLDEPEGEERRDRTGHRYRLAPTGAVGQVAGKIGGRYAAQVDGIGKLSCDGNADVDFDGISYTVWGWYRAAALSGFQSIVTKPGEFDLYCPAGSANSFWFDVVPQPGGGFPVRAQATGVVVVATWFLVMGVVTVTDSGMTVDLYVDNVLADSTAAPGAFPYGTDGGELRVAANTGVSAFAADGAGLCASALTAAERAAIWNGGDGKDYPWGPPAGTLRDVPAGLAAHLVEESLTLAVCVKVTRKDGDVLGFTTHDLALEIDGVTYSALGSVQATGIRQELTTGIDNLDVIGLLQSDRITEDDLRAGLYDGAAITIFLVNWSDLTQGSVVLLRGSLGEVRIQDGQYTAEVRSLGQRLAQQVGDLTTPTCMVKRLGDERCKVDLTAFRFDRVVTAVTDRREMVFGSDSHASGYYTYGMVTFTSGANAGLEREVQTHNLAAGEAKLFLQEPFPYDIQIGDEATLEAGCDRRLETCRDRFANVLNYRGFPSIPGTDKLIQRGTRG